MTTDNALQTWDRQPGETEEAYRAFCSYRDSGWDEEKGESCKRSIRRTWIKLYCSGNKGARGRRPSGTFTKWSTRFEWVKRADAYLDHMRSLQQAARESAIEDQAEEWARRLPIEMTDVGDALLEKAQRMLEFPVGRVRREVENGREIQIVEPGKWNFNTIVNMARLAFELKSLAADRDPPDDLTGDKMRDVAERRARLRKVLADPEGRKAMEKISHVLGDDGVTEEPLGAEHEDES